MRAVVVYASEIGYLVSITYLLRPGLDRQRKRNRRPECDFDQHAIRYSIRVTGRVMTATQPGGDPVALVNATTGHEGTRCEVSDMNTTIESSAPMMQMLKRTVPSTWQPVLNAQLDELERLRAQAADTAVEPSEAAQAPCQWKPDDAHARAVRSARIDAAIAAALAAYTNEGMHNAVSRSRLATLLHDRIAAGIALGKAGGEVPDAFKGRMRKAPCWDTIYDRLKDIL